MNFINPLKILEGLRKFALIGFLAVAMQPSARAGNVIFSFTTTSANGMDLFATSSGALFTGSAGYFALGYVPSTYNFNIKTVNDILNDITILGSASTSNWVGVGTTAPANIGGRVSSFATSAIDTTSFVGSKILAVVGEGSSFSRAANSKVAIVSSALGTGLTAWSVAAPDASPTPVTMTLNVASFDQIFAGTYAASVGNISSGPSRYDTITVIPEPSTASLLLVGLLGLLAPRRRSRSNSKSNVKVSTSTTCAVSVLALISLVGESGQAQSTVSTPIVGFLKSSLPVGQMSMVSFPLLNNPVVASSFTTKSGNTLNCTSVTFVAATISEKNYANEPLYYVEIASGPQSGLILDILSATSTSVTVADASILTGSESFFIRKYLTIADIFGSSNQAGLKSGANFSDADLVSLLVNGTWKQFFYYDDQVGFDPTQWLELGGPSSDAGSARIDPDQGILVQRRAGGVSVNTLVTGVVKQTKANIPVYSGMQIVTNPWPTAMTLDQLGLKTGNSTSGLQEGDSFNTSDIVFKVEGNTWSQYFVYNDQVGFDPVQWVKLGGGGADQGAVVINPGEAILIQRRASPSFAWAPQKNF